MARAARPAVWLLALAVAGCNQHPLTRPSPTPPTLADAGLTRCALAPSQLRPLVVEWSAADRGSLEVRLKAGVVAVRYEGCTLQLLPDCRVPGDYTYHGFTRKHDTLTIRSTDDLYAEMPIGAGRLETRLARSGELQIDMTLVGEYQAVRHGFTADELTGACLGATHVLAAAQVGAFSFHARAETSTDTSATHADAGRVLLSSDGTTSACEATSPAATAAPAECGAPIRLEFSPLLPAAARSSAAPPAQPTPEPTPVATIEPPSGPAVAVQQATDDETPSHARRPAADESPDTYRRGDRAFAVLGGIFAMTVLVGGLVTAAGAAGVIGANKLLREHEPDDLAGIAEDTRYRNVEYRVLYAGIGTTLGAAALSGLFFGLVFRKDRSPTTARLQVTPSIGRHHGGLSLGLRF